MTKSGLCGVAGLMAFGLTFQFAGEGSAFVIPSPLAGLHEGSAVVDAAAFKTKQRHRFHRKRKSLLGHTPPHTSPDKPHHQADAPRDVPTGRPPTSDRKPSKGQKPRLRDKPVIVRKFPRLMCIDGKLIGRRCQCAQGQKAVRLAKRISRCPGAEVAARPVVPSADASKAHPLVAATAPLIRQDAPLDRGPAVAPSPLPDVFVRDEILVTLATAAPPALEQAVAARYALERLDSQTLSLVAVRVVRYRIPDGRSVNVVVSSMQGDAQLLASQPNYLYRRQDDGLQAETAALQYALVKLDISAAHRLARGKGALVAVLDSGIDSSHPDLQGSVADTLAADGDAEKIPGDPHGTEVAAIAVAHGAMQGVAPAAKLLDVRVFEYDGAEPAKLATTVSLLRGLDWAVGKGARVVNMSLAGPADPLLKRVLEALAPRQVIVIAAAGNGGADAPAVFPAAYEGVIAVTATDSRNGLYALANRGSYIDVAAPGVDILSAVPDGAYSMASGTSFAAAHVSGVVALMLSRNPAMTAEEVRRTLELGASDLGEPGMDAEFGAGLVNAASALR